MFDLPEQTTGLPIDPENVAQMMSSLDVFINIRHKPKQNTLSVIIKGVERFACKYLFSLSCPAACFFKFNQSLCITNQATGLAFEKHVSTLDFNDFLMDDSKSTCFETLSIKQKLELIDTIIKNLV